MSLKSTSTSTLLGDNLEFHRCLHKGLCLSLGLFFRFSYSDSSVRHLYFLHPLTPTLNTTYQSYTWRLPHKEERHVIYMYLKILQDMSLSLCNCLLLFSSILDHDWICSKEKELKKFCSALSFLISVQSMSGVQAWTNGHYLLEISDLRCLEYMHAICGIDIGTTDLSEPLVTGKKPPHCDQGILVFL